MGAGDALGVGRAAGSGAGSPRLATDPDHAGADRAVPADGDQDLPFWPLPTLLLALVLLLVGMPHAAPAGSAAAQDQPEAPAGRPRLVLMGVNSQGFEEYLNQTDATTLVRIPAGAFTMGTDDSRARSDEKPAHRVWVGEYLIGKQEVTNRQFKRFLSATGGWSPRENREAFERAGDGAPVVHLDWFGVRAYCRWAGLRLPSEAEWEKAARGDDARRYPWGPTWAEGRAWSARDGGAGPLSVGSRPLGASPYGCLDMSGNVWEWCLGWHDRYSGAGGASAAGSAACRVVRGGSWSSEPAELRTTVRVPVRPGVLDHYGNLGFRVALTWPIGARQPRPLPAGAEGPGGRP